MGKSDTQWFIKPLGSYISANEEVARVLSKVGLSIECEVFSLTDEKKRATSVYVESGTLHNSGAERQQVSVRVSF